MKRFRFLVCTLLSAVFIVSCNEAEDHNFEIRDEEPLSFEILNFSGSSLTVTFDAGKLLVPTGECFSIPGDSFFLASHPRFGDLRFWVPRGDDVVPRNFRPNPDPYVYIYHGSIRMVIDDTGSIYAVPCFYEKDAFGKLFDNGSLHAEWFKLPSTKWKLIATSQPLGFPLDGAPLAIPKQAHKKSTLDRLLLAIGKDYK